MKNSPLKTAILGLDEKGQFICEVAAKIDYFHIEAVADKDTSLAEKIAQQYNCTPYDDYRQLITQNQFDCLLVAAGMYSCDEYIRTAMKKKFNILKLTPPARSFEETLAFVQLAQEENVIFAVINTNRFAASSITLQNLIQQGKIEHPLLISALYTDNSSICPPWHTDKKLSGGGVLLRHCYEIIDQIISNFNMPQQVYSLTTSTASDKKQRLFLTEDTSVVTMKFTETLFANLIATKTIGPQQNSLKIYTKDKIIAVDNNQLIISDALGKVIEKLKYEDDEASRMTELFKNFAQSITEPQLYKLRCPAADNLNNMAVIESAYLSTRTGMPEEPARICQIASQNHTTPHIKDTSKTNI